MYFYKVFPLGSPVCLLVISERTFSVVSCVKWVQFLFSQGGREE